MEGKEDLIQKYKEFITLINNNIDNEIKLDDDSIICDKTKKYYEEIKENKKLKKYLLDRREKLFFSGNITLIDGINIRKILEKLNEEDNIKIWNYLQLFYILNASNDNFTLKLIENIESQLKSTPDEIIEDLVSNIKDLVNDIDLNDNPLEKIMNISKSLADKYRDDINEGKIKLEDILKYINKYVTSSEVGDAFFKDLDFSEDNLNGIFENLLNSDQIQNLLNLKNGDNFNMENMNLNMVDGLFKNLLENNIENEEDKLEDTQIKEMEKYFENISTEDVNPSILSNKTDYKNNSEETQSENISKLLFSQINNIKNNLAKDEEDENQIKEDDFSLEKITQLKDELMGQLTTQQQDEIHNLTNTILSGFNIKTD